MNKLVVVVLSVFLTGCASTPRDTEVYRLTPDELAQLTTPASPAITLDEIVKFSQLKLSADEIIAKIRQSNSQYDLTPSQIIDLSKKGVDVRVLDFIQTEREKARLNSLAEEINQREEANANAQEKLRQELEMRRNRYDPFYDPFYYPYPGYGFYPYWYNRFYWGPSIHYRRR